MNRLRKCRAILSFAACAAASLITPPLAMAEECSNQAIIDTCVFACGVTEVTCGALCGAATFVCEGVCDGVFATCDLGCDACDIACDICCPSCCCDIGFGEVCSPDICAGGCGSCESSCSSCHSSCRGTRTSCKNGCQADCDDCLFCTGACPACIPFKQIGESCIPFNPGFFGERCADGLTCWPVAFPGQSAFQCFPTDTDNLLHDESCLAVYSSDLHEGAISIGNALSFGAGAAAAAGVGTSVESGTVYGPNGCYGCYLTQCVGVETNAGVSAFASVGLTISYEDFSGESLALIETAGGVLSFSTAQIFNLDGDLTGTADCLSLGVSVFPISAGFYDCNTIVDTVGCLDASGNLVPVANESPIAACAEVTTCADAATCVADASIDNGSTDPDGDPLTFGQSPPSPYAIGARTVTLTVTDPDGASGSCTASVTVDDCTSPEITCPAPSTAECESLEQAVVDPGDATATDTCSSVTVNDPGASSFPLGTTSVVYTATDGAGNATECSTTVTVQDTTDPAIDCPANLTVECDGAGNTGELNDWLAAATGSDGCGDVAITNDFVALSDECGATGLAVVTWTVEDVGGNTASCTATFTILDTLLPTIVCPEDATLECPADTSIAANGSPDADDDCSDVLVESNDVVVPGPGGTETVTRSWKTTDDCGFVSECDQVIDVVDTTRPLVTCSVATDVLWPPNHDFAEVGYTVSIFDACDQAGATESMVIEVWSDEPEIPSQSDGTGNFSPDAKDIDTRLLLRKERSGKGDGRVYLIVAKAVDGSANTGFGFCTVVVPHDKGKKGLADVEAQADAALAMVQGAADTSTSIADVVAALVGQGWTRHGVSEEIGPRQKRTNSGKTKNR